MSASPSSISLSHHLSLSLYTRMIADKHIPTACVKFAEEKGSEILQKNHVNSFLAHLVSLCQFGLISLPVMKTSMDILNAKRAFS